MHSSLQQALFSMNILPNHERNWGNIAKTLPHFLVFPCISLLLYNLKSIGSLICHDLSHSSTGPFPAISQAGGVRRREDIWPPMSFGQRVSSPLENAMQSLRASCLGFDGIIELMTVNQTPKDPDLLMNLVISGASLGCRFPCWQQENLSSDDWYLLRDVLKLPISHECWTFLLKLGVNKVFFIAASPAHIQPNSPSWVQTKRFQNQFPKYGLQLQNSTA